MSESYTTRAGRHNIEIEPATEEEERAMREEFEEFARSTGGYQVRCLHIQRPGSSDPDPICGEKHRVKGLIRKPIPTYPLGYKPICRNCVREWRDRNE